MPSRQHVSSVPAPRSRTARLACGLALLLAALAIGGTACRAPARYRDPAAPAPAPRLLGAIVGAADTVDGHLVQPVRLRAASGLTVDLLLKRPVAAGDGAAGLGGGRDAGAWERIPVVVLLGGHHAGREAAKYIPDTRGRAVAALSYPYAGKHRLSAFEALRAAPAIRRAILDTPPAIRLALDWLLAQPWADTTQVEGIGASLGVPFMTVAAARDRRITRLWSVHGAGDVRRLLSHNTRKYVGLKPVRWLAVRATHRLVAGEQLSPERWIAQVSPRPFVMINATEDERMPREAILTLYDAAREPKELIWLPGKHVQRNRPEIVRALVDTVLARMD